MKRLSLIILFSLGLLAGPSVDYADAGPKYKGGSSSSQKSNDSSKKKAPKASESSKKKSGFDSDAGKARERQKSKEKYNKYKQDKEREKSQNSASEKPPSVGQDKKSSTPRNNSREARGSKKSSNSARSSRLRDSMTQEQYETRTTRVETFYGPQYSTWSSSPPVRYDDPFSSVFHYWLLSQSIDSQAQWMYHHQNSMDQQRYADMISQNSDLQRRIALLESQGSSRDPSYRPGDMDEDLMYSNDFVDSSINPVSKHTFTPKRPKASDKNEPKQGNNIMSYFCCGGVSVVLLLLLIWGVYCYAKSQKDVS